MIKYDIYRNGRNYNLVKYISREEILTCVEQRGIKEPFWHADSWTLPQEADPGCLGWDPGIHRFNKIAWEFSYSGLVPTQ